jgi:hypothetical protein
LLARHESEVTSLLPADTLGEQRSRSLIVGPRSFESYRGIELGVPLIRQSPSWAISPGKFSG